MAEYGRYISMFQENYGFDRIFTGQESFTKTKSLC